MDGIWRFSPVHLSLTLSLTGRGNKHTPIEKERHATDYGVSIKKGLPAVRIKG
jgi:hypothetical protein